MPLAPPPLIPGGIEKVPVDSQPLWRFCKAGSVASLSLANMLEKFDIDYVVLEAYPDIAPQVGASIGLLPNGLRILDQLGCYEAYRAKAEHQVYQQAYLREASGKAYGYQHDLMEMWEKM